MNLGALATGLLTGGASLLGGFGAASAQRKRDMANVRAVATANYVNASRATKLNNELRQRADKAAKVPVVTTTKYGRTDTVSGDVDTDAFLSQAAKMGVNPLTLIRSGSLGLYGRTKSVSSGQDVVTTTGERAMDAALAGQNIYFDQANTLLGAPPQTTGQILGGGLSDGLGAYSQIASQDAQNAFQLKYLQQQTSSQMRLQSMQRAVMGAVAGGVTGGGVHRGGGGLGSDNTAGENWVLKALGRSWASLAAPVPAESDLNARYDEAGTILQAGDNAWRDWLLAHPEYAGRGKIAENNLVKGLDTSMGDIVDLLAGNVPKTFRGPPITLSVRPGSPAALAADFVWRAFVGNGKQAYQGRK